MHICIHITLSDFVMFLIRVCVAARGVMGGGGEEIIPVCYCSGSDVIITNVPKGNVLLFKVYDWY